ATTLIGQTGPGGNLRFGGRAIGLFEVDEAVLPAAARTVHPRLVVLANLFRDQLDRYGEVDIVAAHWREMVAALDAGATLVYNADDPLVAAIAAGHRGRAIAFGVGDASAGHAGLEHAADARWCGNCGAAFAYSVSFYGHLGHYRCPQCGVARPEPAVAATEIRRLGMEGSEVTVRTPEGAFRLRLPLPGLYNVYNAL